ncbi:hypothetical protein GCM10010172_83060 [Paractinoplanes ferrugineus]|uniref:Uncharacterized protein n=1 Tax=Paractinoplanes ferrugineus TaxID=113564 RepID=A0A919IZG2_9ACTN|nr:hypothetical protein Afe05nite_24670 [Actinoplanes ferrugineus]
MCGVAAESHDFARARHRRPSESRNYLNHVDRSRRGYSESSDPYLNSVRHEPREPVEPGRGEAIQALTRDVLIRRSLEVSPNGFITIISIIQGVALALLAQNTFPRPTLLICVQSITLLLVFVSVFYYYLTMSVLLRWAPSFLDCFLPFAIAGLEIPPAFFLGDVSSWCMWLAAFWLFTMAGLWITGKWSPPSHFGEARQAWQAFQKYTRELRLTTGGGGLAVLVCGLLAAGDPWHETLWGTLAAAVVLGTVAMIVYRTEMRAAEIHAYFGVSRPPFN